MKIQLRNWKPQKETQKMVDLILELVEEYDVPLSVRQVHYRLVEIPKANLPNTMSTYQKVSRILTNMRYAGLLDWDKIVDETRTIYKTTSYENIDEALNRLLERYRRNRWIENEYYLEVWTEKRTLISQFYEITNEYDVFLASGGGFSSSTYIYRAVGRLSAYRNKKIVILYFGDLDPSGDFMDEDIEKRFAEWGINLEFRRIALTEEQLDKYKLQKKFDVKKKYGNEIKNKIAQDPRAKRMLEKYGEIFQVELEALSPKVLNELLKNSILEFANLEQQEKVIQVEEKEIEDIKEVLSCRTSNNHLNKQEAGK